MSQKKTIREKFAAGEPTFGMTIYTGVSATVEIAGNWGLDFAFIDAEHTAVDIDQQMEKLILSAKVAGIAPLVRVRGTIEWDIRKSLELGAAGVIEPARAEKLIEATRFLRQVQEALRLMVGPAFDADSLSDSLQAALAASVGVDDFAELRARLEETLAWAHAAYVEAVDAVAPPAGDDPDKGVLPFAKGA